MIEIQATMTTQEATIRDDTLKEMVKYLNAQNVLFSKGALKVHRKTVFEILIFLIRVCPVLTGLLRGSWTPYLNRWGKQASYERYMDDRTLVQGQAQGQGRDTAGRFAKSRARGLNQAAVAEGRGQGGFTEAGLTTTVFSNVVYAARANSPSGYFDRAVENANRIINANFENYLRLAREAGWIPPADFSDDPRPEE